MPTYWIKIDVPVVLPLEALKEIEDIVKQIAKKYVEQAIGVEVYRDHTRIVPPEREREERILTV